MLHLVPFFICIIFQFSLQFSLYCTSDSFFFFFFNCSYLCFTHLLNYNGTAYLACFSLAILFQDTNQLLPHLVFSDQIILFCSNVHLNLQSPKYNIHLLARPHTSTLPNPPYPVSTESTWPGCSVDTTRLFSTITREWISLLQMPVQDATHHHT